ncbi:hypothetical protein M0804_003890 [Polistes exclamans]|nr:hypothetical protein M0804_003890 [Polistes exclamans]
MISSPPRALSVIIAFMNGNTAGRRYAWVKLRKRYVTTTTTTTTITTTTTTTTIAVAAAAAAAAATTAAVD